MKTQVQETTKEILERIYTNLCDHQGCSMTIELTQALMKDCEELLRRQPNDK